MSSNFREAWTAEARRKSLESRQAHAKGKIDGPSAKHDAAPKLPDQSAVSGVVSEIFAEGRKMLAGGKIEHTEEEKGWIAKGYAHPDDIGTFRKARDVVEKINKLHDMSLTLHPKRRPLVGAAGGLYDTNKGEISLVARYKQSKEYGGKWAGRPQTDEELTQTLGHEIAHHYEYGHNQRHRDTEEHFVGLVRRLWNGESVQKSSLPGSQASAAPKTASETAHEHSAKAEELSAKAKSENTAESHKAAFAANHNAASHHLKAANEALDKGDIKAAAEHSKKQDEHMSRAMFHDQSRAAVSG